MPHHLLSHQLHHTSPLCHFLSCLNCSSPPGVVPTQSHTLDTLINATYKPPNNSVCLFVCCSHRATTYTAHQCKVMAHINKYGLHSEGPMGIWKHCWNCCISGFMVKLEPNVSWGNMRWYVRSLGWLTCWCWRTNTRPCATSERVSPSTMKYWSRMLCWCDLFIKFSKSLKFV